MAEEAEDCSSLNDCEAVDGDFGKDNGEVSCNLDNVYDSLKTGLVNADDVSLGSYLIAYRELYNFFVLLGGAFRFVATDVKSKIKILHDFRTEEREKSKAIVNFSTVKKMINYEIDNKLLENKKYVSGSRTLLRLHRGLDFIRKFLQEVHKLEDSVKIGQVCRETYDNTLANFHTWGVKKTASLAMHLLPTKEELFKKIAKNDVETIQRAHQQLPEMLDIMKVVYDRVENLYTVYKLHDLP